MLSAGERPNILFFITEDQSMHLGCLGTKGLDTPNLDKFASSGTSFTRNFTLSPVCSPSKMALLSGTFPHPNSAIRNVYNYGIDFPLPADSDPSDTRLGGVHEDLPTLIEILKRNDIFTAVTSKSHVQPIRKFPYDIGYPHPSGPEAPKTIILEIIAKAGGKPFFICYNTSAPHLPFRNIPRLHKKWANTGGLADDGHVTHVNPADVIVPDCYPDVPAVRQDITDYYGAIECVDSVFQNVLTALQDAGELDNTLIILTSDHGIGLHRAKQSIYSAGLQVPLLIRAPDSLAGQTIDHSVSHLDLVPTFLDYLAIEKPESMIGKSLRPLVKGKKTGFPDRPTILTACHRYYNARAITDGDYYYIQNLSQPQGGSLAKPQRVLNQDQYKAGPPWFNRTYEATVAAKESQAHTLLKQLVEGGLPQEELYHLASDPWMTRNLFGSEHEADLPLLKEELAKWQTATLDTPDNLIRRTQ